MKDNLKALLAGEDDVEVSVLKPPSGGTATPGTTDEEPCAPHGEYDPVIVESYTTQLGFLEEGRNQLFLDQDRDNWTDGRVGGKPIWMDPAQLPPAKHLLCPSCGDPMAFVLQIYCPLDAPESAYHRCLYLFVCRKKACVALGGFKCLRDQYAKELEIVQPDAPKCDVCGCLGTLLCSRCHVARYCSAVHQRLGWKAHRESCAAMAQRGSDIPDAIESETSNNPFLFPEYDLVVETEVLEESTVPLEAEVNVDSEDEGDGADEGEAAEQLDTDRHIAERTGDVAYLRFMNRVRRGGSSQVLRYVQPSALDGGTGAAPRPLATTSDACAPDKAVPPCPRCNAPRVFEFQVMPQMLYYLNVDKETTVISGTTCADGLLKNEANEDFEWGSLDVYTCSKSCDPASYTTTPGSAAKFTKAYGDEFVWRQETPEVVAMRANEAAAAALRMQSEDNAAKGASAEEHMGANESSKAKKRPNRKTKKSSS